MTDSIHPVGFTFYRNVQPLSADIEDRIQAILATLADKGCTLR